MKTKQLSKTIRNYINNYVKPGRCEMLNTQSMACKIKRTDYFKSEQNQCNKKIYMFEIYTFKPLLLKSYMC